MTVPRPAHLNAYEFAVLSALRTHQLMAGCMPRLSGEHRATTMAQMEVADGCVASAGGYLTVGHRRSRPQPL